MSLVFAAIFILSIEFLILPHSICLGKIDAEGHDISVLKGMESILREDHPILIIEDDSSEIGEYLEEFDYSFERINGSHNKVFS